MAVGSANLDWKKLGFGVQPTDGHAYSVWKDGAWSEVKMVKEPYIQMHVNSVGLHYGQVIWEGMKAFHSKDGSVHTFNDVANWERLSKGAERMLIPGMSLEFFRAAVDLAVNSNLSRVPPYGTGGAMYIRPILLGHGPQLGLASAKEFVFMVIVSPVGNYFAAAPPEILEKGAPGKVVLEFDRSAARGMGAVKCSGNYGADLYPSYKTKAEGFTVGLYLDPVEQRYIEEFNVTNFACITNEGTYITPSESTSILNSITNKCLMRLAEDMGLKVERRKIDFLKEVHTFKEVAAVGTAAVVLPIRSLTMNEQTFTFEQHDVMRKLKQTLESIQIGDAPDKHGWTRKISMTPQSHESDHQTEEAVTLKNDAEALCNQVEKQMSDLTDRISTADADDLRAKMSDLRQAMESIRIKTKNLQEASSEKISERLVGS